MKARAAVLVLIGLAAREGVVGEVPRDDAGPVDAGEVDVGFTSTLHVFWRVRTVTLHPSAQQCVVETAQYGYVIGASGPGHGCTTCVANSCWTAGDQGRVNRLGRRRADAVVPLHPPSLYLDQRDKRCAREGLSCTAGVSLTLTRRRAGARSASARRRRARWCHRASTPRAAPARR